jgi:hypothetical protein
MAHRRRDRRFKNICQLAAFRVGIVWRTVEALVPDFPPQKKKRLCNRILTLLDGKDRTVKITQVQAQALILPPHAVPSKGMPGVDLLGTNRSQPEHVFQ